MRTSPTGSRRAFTLVELTVVVIILAVLATMIVPRLYSATGSARLRSSAGRLLVTARYARDYAATHRCDCWLMIDPAEDRYGLAYQQDPEHRPGEMLPLRAGIGKPERLGKGIRFSKVRIKPRHRGRGSTAEEQSGSIVFQPAGRADAAVVEITDGKRKCSLLVAPNTGEARLVEGAVSGLPDDRVDLDE